MYINPFLAGILFTLLMEVILFVAYALFNSKK